MALTALNELLGKVQSSWHHLEEPYFLPGLWLNPGSGQHQGIAVNPFEFYIHRLQDIVGRDAIPLSPSPGGGEWSQTAIVYNLFPRVTTAFDHNGDGTVTAEVTRDGWKETGTLLKCIALLPYIQHMGFNTIHLLPITSVGQDGKKGSVGSPYGIRNAYKLDENLADPVVGADAELLFRAFVEAAHHLGIRIVMEFVLRTSSKDGDWVAEHPNWFYWIKASIPDRELGSDKASHYGPPIFPEDDLNHLKAKVNSGDMHHLPPPPQAYRDMFTAIPEQVEMVDGTWIGTLNDGTKVRIPGAFADWPPDDNQPPWTDVTYLRLFDHPDFNYIAYNTIRMYDNRLATEQNINRALWDTLVGVIPHFQQSGIDGVMIDMGHALPPLLKQQMVKAVRDINSDFAFWDENFSISGHSRHEGYNAVMGFLPFDTHDPEKIRGFIKHRSYEDVPISFFATAENHNTPRAAGRDGGFIFSLHAYSLFIGLPGIPWVHSGFELMETTPINTGLGFTTEEIEQFPSDMLGLFSVVAYRWTRHDNIVESIRYANGLRKKYQVLLSDSRAKTILAGYSDNSAITVFARYNQHDLIIFIANTDMILPQHGRAVIHTENYPTYGMWGTDHTVSAGRELSINVDLRPGNTLILDGRDLKPLLPPFMD